MEKNRKELKTFNDYKMDYPPEIQKRLKEIRTGSKKCSSRSKRKN
jgi:hypothetical protein